MPRLKLLVSRPSPRRRMRVGASLVVVLAGFAGVCAPAGMVTTSFAFQPVAPPLPDTQKVDPERQPDVRVSTRQQLVDALANAEASGKKYIWVENYAQIDLGAVGDQREGLPFVLKVPAGVTLASGRSSTQEGGLLYMSRRLPKQYYMLRLGPNTRITGLRLRGYARDTVDRGDVGAPIGIRDDRDASLAGNTGILIDNNEISFWPGAGVAISQTPNAPMHGPVPPGRSCSIEPACKARAAQIRVTRNFIHDNLQCNAGYGVVVASGAYAYVDRNVFDMNRHAVSSDGIAGTGYFAEFNFVLRRGYKCGHGAYDQHFDVHGQKRGHILPGDDFTGDPAGEYVEIRRNAIRGDQRYYVIRTRPAFSLRAEPSDTAVFADNVLAHHDEGDAIHTNGDRSDYERRGKLIAGNNTYSLDTSRELAVGDFDGDRRADVFQATGAMWVYSPGGRREWHFLNGAAPRLRSLRFGDFNGDGKTDVFTQRGSAWLVSYGATGPWVRLPVGSSVDMRTYGFGDFDGDGKTDVFRATGSRWYYASVGGFSRRGPGARGRGSPWRPLLRSPLTIGQLRFGDFNGDRKTDVFSLVNGQWSISYGGATGWRRFHDLHTPSLNRLVLADFNGDRRTDVARSAAVTGKSKWQVSWSGTTPWRILNNRAMPQISAVRVGDFNGDRRADALGGTDQFAISSGATGPLGSWSLFNMS